MVEDIKKDARTRMQKSVEALRHEMSKLRTGRAHASLLDHVTVSYYGADTPLNQVASVTVSDPRTLLVAPWEKKIVPDVEKAIMNSDLGLNPISAGDVIRVPLPPLTEERRVEMTRVVRHEAENARIAIRNIRRDANQHLKALIKDEHLAKDAEHKAETDIQQLTDKFISEVDEVLKEKEQDLMEV
ncbi:MAG TPA: ribosome recycling factor [Gammaproteobacteria bacterium]